MKRRVRAGHCQAYPASVHIDVMKILLFLRRKPYRRPVIPLARYNADFAQGPKSSSAAQVETPQRVAPRAGFFIGEVHNDHRRDSCTVISPVSAAPRP